VEPLSWEINTKEASQFLLKKTNLKIKIKTVKINKNDNQLNDLKNINKYSADTLTPTVR